MKSVFTERLQQLGKYSEKVDDGTLTHDDFGQLQPMESQIIDAYKGGQLINVEYRVLMGAYYYIKDGAREVLGLDRVYDALKHPKDTF